MGTAGVPPCQPPALGSVSLPGCLGRRYLSPLGRAEGSSFLKPLVGSPLHLAHCGSPATEGHQELRGPINNQVTGGSCRLSLFFPQSHQRQQDEARPFKWLLCSSTWLVHLRGNSPASGIRSSWYHCPGTHCSFWLHLGALLFLA